MYFGGVCSGLYPRPPLEKYPPVNFPCGGGGDTITLSFPFLTTGFDIGALPVVYWLDNVVLLLHCCVI